MSTLQLRITASNIFCIFTNNTHQFTRSLGCYDVKNAKKHFPSAFDEACVKYVNEIKNKYQPTSLYLVFSGFRSNTRSLLVKELVKNKIAIISIEDKTRLAFNGCRQQKKRR